MELEINVNNAKRSMKPVPNKFLEFEDQLVRIFNLVSLKDCDIKYKDSDNDMVTISNNDEYTYMINFFKNRKIDVIELFVREKSQNLNQKYGFF